jgi:hypothetical protein
MVYNEVARCRSTLPSIGIFTNVRMCMNRVTHFYAESHIRDISPINETIGLDLSTARTDWNKEARRILKSELARRDLTYKQLLKQLHEAGMAEETERSIVNKVSRGTFSFAFFIMCMRALGAEQIDIGPLPESRLKAERKD